MRGLPDKTVVVTGGARGIGAAICRRFVEEGSRVAVFDILAADVAALQEQFGDRRIAAYRVDITDGVAVADSIARVEVDLGPIDILINNAGRNVPTPFVESESPHWHDMISHNLVGPLNLHRSVLPSMIRRGQGRIVSVASDAGRVGAANEAVYSACKGGVIAFSKALAKEVARHKIAVNVVCPGPTETQLFRDVAGEGARADQFRAAFIRATPLGRMGEPNDVVGAVCFLASDDAAFITGQVLSVSGGLTMVG